VSTVFARHHHCRWRGDPLLSDAGRASRWRTVTTIEGLPRGPGEALAACRKLRKHHALQCGFCTPGILTTAHALLSEEPDADADRIREVLSGNLCRCTGYVSIIDAVLDARPAYQNQKAAE
jgi:carbon-monoxide dehydrogenase small subunit